jgi:hypothetical protein
MEMSEVGGKNCTARAVFADAGRYANIARSSAFSDGKRSGAKWRQTCSQGGCAASP